MDNDHPPTRPNYAISILSTVQFLSRLPLPASWVSHEKPDFENNGWTFPIAGALICAPAIVVMVVANFLGLSAEVIASLAIVTQLAVTGALHEDGVADIADGFGGGISAERKLEIMKDSSVGAFGVVALISVFLLRFAALSSLLSISIGLALAGFVAAQMASRAGQIWFWQSLPAAREDGLSSKFGTPSPQSCTYALIIGVAAFALPILVGASFWSILVALGLLWLLIKGFQSLCLSQIGGQTGDALGAVQIIAEIAILIGLVTFTA